MSAEKPELPIERLLLAFARTHGGEENTNTRLGAQMLEGAKQTLQAAWEWHCQKPQGQELDDWDGWAQLILVIPVYNLVAKTMNLPTIQVPEPNALARTGAQKKKVSLEQLALACMRAGEYLHAQTTLVENALKYGKYARR